ncbi:MAG: HNH endonuclease [Dehalococcoidia bacterium]
MHDESIISRFWSYVDSSAGPDACWEWTRSRIHDGYGRFWDTKRMWRAHRFAWTITHGDIPDGIVVLHKCDNPPCCNPSHLALGTTSDNNWDKVHKGRFQDQRGERNPYAKLTADDVRAIREALKGGESQSSIATRHNVSQSNISFIALGKSWRHVQ